MASPDARAYPHYQPAIELTIPYYKNWMTVSILLQNATVHRPRFDDGGQDRQLPLPHPDNLQIS